MYKSVIRLRWKTERIQLIRLTFKPGTMFCGYNSSSLSDLSIIFDQENTIFDKLFTSFNTSFGCQQINQKKKK